MARALIPAESRSVVDPGNLHIATKPGWPYLQRRLSKSVPEPCDLQDAKFREERNRKVGDDNGTALSW